MPGGSSSRRRLDLHLVAAGLFEHREQARAAIEAGWVKLDGEVELRPGASVRLGAGVLVTGGPRFVSRGGDKLDGALSEFALDVTGLVALDAGASTGGFVDCLLQRGAAHVIAVDVGYGQLAWKLRQDVRVTVIERQNIRYLTREMLGPKLPPGVGWPALVTLDLSFIGLEKVFPAVRSLIEPGGMVLALVKPQFQVGRGLVGKGGVVRRPELHRQAILSAGEAALLLGFGVLGATYSKLKGPRGNVEYFLLLRAGGAGLAGDSSEKTQLEKTGAARSNAQDLHKLAQAAVDAAGAALGVREP
ncbi:MAG: TlyA family RNA methyltransferase [Bacillota bacterium]|nr:TlyA family RNA methyltransferase [Bacillota bacterium]